MSRFRFRDGRIDATLTPAGIRDYLIDAYADRCRIELDASNISVRLQYGSVGMAQRLARIYVSPTISITAEETHK